ncbi:MAG: 50S ribosomal protein L6 [Candidatus Neomarinimicrobiota bacterium]|nr:50S ribosomal protein L6 [Candidatus Neomarinimicrobiota bacterium]|tara:strand:- start:797 stop:1342 length:546 start_codon:yes stop_codon:yes gene_type:complete
MSRIGQKTIQIPESVSFSLNNGTARISGPQGELEVLIIKGIDVKSNDNKITVSRSSEERKYRAMHGTVRQLISNAVKGVSVGFAKELELRGVGYQANMQGNRLHLQLGFSHDILFETPEGINIRANRTEISVTGYDKQLVGEVAAKIRSFRKPEPYKGKGIRYKGEYVRQKQGKTVGGDVS